MTFWLLLFQIQLEARESRAYDLVILRSLQELLQKSGATDASGNVILSDIGVHMQQKVCMR